MSSNKIYVVHEYGAPTHYHALVELATQKGYQVVFRELWTYRFAAKHPDRWLRYLLNKLFWIIVPFLPKSKIVLGIAPFNNKLKKYMHHFRHHECYYHTSYSCWDGSMQAHPARGEDDINLWKNFTNEYVKHIFAVSEKTKSELISNGFASEDRISIVNHSYTDLIQTTKYKKKENSFIYVGRVNEQKGIKELLNIFENHPEASLTIIGSGEEQELVKEYSIKCQNIKYLGYIKGLSNILPHYHNNCFSILNSHRVSHWEELFGIAVIEGMSCGCVPITTNHPGPREIITSGINGYIFSEGDIETGILQAISLSDSDYNMIRVNTIERGSGFNSKSMSTKWQALFVD